MQRQSSVKSSESNKSRSLSKRKNVIADVVRRASASTVEPLEKRFMLTSVGFNFTGGYSNNGATPPFTIFPVTLGPSDTAGVMPTPNNSLYTGADVSQTNWNNLNGANTSATSAILDNTGAASPIQLSWTSGGTWAAANGSSNIASTPQEALNDGFISGSGASTISVTLTNIPYQQYDVYLYTLNDAIRVQTTSAYGVTYYQNSPDPRGVIGVNSWFLDSDPSTTYTYVQATSRTAASPTQNADFVVYHLQGGSTWTGTVFSPGNGYLNAVQIVQTSGGIPDAPVQNNTTNFPDQVTLNWTGALGGFTYQIFRGTSAGTESATAIATITASTATLTNGNYTFQDTTALPKNSTFFYTIKSVSPSGTFSVASNEKAGVIDANAAPPIVQNFVATTNTTVPSIALTWTAVQTTPTPYATGYTIQRAVVSGTAAPGAIPTFTTYTTINDATVSTYTDLALTNGNSYLYKIIAFNGPQPAGPFVSGPASSIVGGGINVAGTGDGLSGYYYNSANDTTTLRDPFGNQFGTFVPFYSRIDGTINQTGTANIAPTGAPLNWTSNGGVGVSFAITWKGYVQPKYNETYTFIPGADDGDLLLITDLNGNVQTLDSDFAGSHGIVDHPKATTFSMVAGQKYFITMYYREGGGGWGVHLLWQSPSQTQEIIPTSQLYALAPLAPTLTGAANDTVALLNWTGVGADQIKLFRGTSLGTVNTLVTNLPGSATTYLDTGLTNATQYYYQIVANVLNGGGGAVFGTTPSNIISVTPNTGTLAAPTLSANSPFLSWNRVTLNWGAVTFAQRYHVFRSPNSDGTSAIELTSPSYSNTLAPYQGLTWVDTTVTMGNTYFYYVTSQFKNITSAVTAASIKTADLVHGAEVHYYNQQFWASNTENGNGNAPSPLGFEITGVGLGGDNYNGQVLGGISSSLLNGTNYGGRQPDSLGFMNNVDIDYNSASPQSGVNATSISAVYSGKIHNNTTGTFTFYTNSDDDSYIFIDGKLVASDPNGHGQRDILGSLVNLAAGDHSIVIFWSQGGGGAGMHARYSFNGSAVAPISVFNTAAALYFNSYISDTPPAPNNAPVGIPTGGGSSPVYQGNASQTPTVQLGFTNRLTNSNNTTNNSVVAFIVERQEVGVVGSTEWLPVTTAGVGYDTVFAPNTGTGSHVSAFDATAVPGHTYLYRVRAANFDGISDPSAVSSPIAIPSACTNAGWSAPGSYDPGVEAHYYNDLDWGSPINRGSGNTNTIPQWGGGGYLWGQASNRSLADSVLNFASGTSSPFLGDVVGLNSIHNLNFSVVFTGKIRIINSGTYTFVSNSDDDGYLYVSNGTQQVLASRDPGGHGVRMASDTATNVTAMVLNPGNYDFQFFSAQGGGGWGQSMFYKGTTADGNNNTDTNGNLMIIPTSAINGSPFTGTTSGTTSLSTAPIAVNAVTASTLSNTNRTTISWTDNNVSEVRYFIERATDTAFTQNVTATETGVNASSFTDVIPPGGTTSFYYRVRAENYDAVAPWTATTAPVVAPNVMPAPSGVSALQVGSEIHVAWTNNNSPGASEAGTLIQRKTDSGLFTNLFTTQRNVNTFTDQTALPGHTYTYQIQTIATNLAGVNPISSASEVGTVATVNALGNYSVGQSVVVAGLSVAGYNGTFTITAVGDHSFSYTAASGLAAVTVPGTATATVTTPASAFSASGTVAYVDATGNVDRTTGFNTADGGTLLQLNAGGANTTGPTILSTGALRLLDGPASGAENRTAFLKAGSGFLGGSNTYGGQFYTEFDFQISGAEVADGFSFILQRGNSTANGGTNGNNGWTGSGSAGNSVGIYTNLWQNVSETGLMLNGNKTQTVSLNATPIGNAFHSLNQAVITLNGAPNGSPTGGTFTLIVSKNGTAQTTPGIAFNAPASDVQTALRTLSGVGATGVTVAGNAGGPYTATFTPTLSNLAVLTSTSALTYAPATVTVASPSANNFNVTESANATGGTFTLIVTDTAGTQTTAGIAFNATPAAVQTALAALSNVGATAGNVTVVAGTGGAKYAINFGAGLGVSAVTANAGSLTVTTGIAINMIGDVFHATISYDGAGAMTYTLTDKNTGAAFSTSYALDPTQIMLDQNTFAGFTGGSGSPGMNTDILNWWWSPTGQKPPVTINGTSAVDNIYFKAETGGAVVDYWLNSATPGTAGTQTGSYANTTTGVRIHGLGAADVITADETNGPVFIPTTQYAANIFATGGSYTITVNLATGPVTTSTIAWNATPATVQAAIGALAGIGAANVTVIQNATNLGANAAPPYYITFAPTVAANVTSVTANGASLTNPLATMTVANPLVNNYTLTESASTIGGTFTLTVVDSGSVGGSVAGTQTTAPIAFNATPAQVQAALALLTNVGATVGNVAVTAGTGGALYAVAFASGLGVTTFSVNQAGLLAPAATATVTVPGGNFGSSLDSVSSVGVSGGAIVNVIGTSANETFLADSTNSRFAFSTATKADSLGLANVSQINYTDGGGNDTITVNGSTPTTINAGVGTDAVTVTAGSTANFSWGASNAGTLNGTVAGTLNVLEGNGTAHTITLGGAGSTNITPGTGSTALTVNGGTATITANTGAAIRPVTNSIISVGAGAKLVVATNTNHLTRSVLTVPFSGLTINATGLIDLNDNDMIVSGAAAAGLTAIQAQIAAGANGNSWNGTHGITSTKAKTVGITGLGYALNNGSQIAKFTTFDGVAVGTTDAIVKYTYQGDADLNGKTNTDDYFYIDSNIPLATGSTWVLGDFDYNGKTNTDDYFWIDSNIGDGSGGGFGAQL